jgi:hypothetical protein
VKLTSDSFCGNGDFSSTVTYIAVVLWFLETILLSVRRSLSVIFYFCQLFLFADVVFPWFVYADITLETVALDTPNNVAIFVIDAPAKRGPTICPLSKLGKSPIVQLFHTDCRSIQSTMHLHDHYKVCSDGRRPFTVANWSSFSVTDTNFIPQFLSVSVFFAFCMC